MSTYRTFPEGADSLYVYTSTDTNDTAPGGWVFDTTSNDPTTVDTTVDTSSVLKDIPELTKFRQRVFDLTEEKAALSQEYSEALRDLKNLRNNKERTIAEIRELQDALVASTELCRSLILARVVQQLDDDTMLPGLLEMSPAADSGLTLSLWENFVPELCDFNWIKHRYPEYEFRSEGGKSGADRRAKIMNYVKYGLDYAETLSWEVDKYMKDSKFEAKIAEPVNPQDGERAPSISCHIQGELLYANGYGVYAAITMPNYDRLALDRTTRQPPACFSEPSSLVSEHAQSIVRAATQFIQRKLHEPTTTNNQVSSPAAEANNQRRDTIDPVSAR